MYERNGEQLGYNLNLKKKYAILFANLYILFINVELGQN